MYLNMVKKKKISGIHCKRESTTRINLIICLEATCKTDQFFCPNYVFTDYKNKLIENLLQ